MQKIKADSTIVLSIFTLAYVVSIICYLVLIGKSFDPYDLDRPEQYEGYTRSYLYALYAAGLLPWVILALGSLFEKSLSNRAWLVLSAGGVGAAAAAAYLIMRL